MITANDVIEKLGLKPLPEEGGYYLETYRSQDDGLPADCFGIKSEKTRNISTAIFYLVTPEEFSSLHRIKGDEIFHFYAGDPVEMLQINDTGEINKIILGSDVLNGEQPQVVVPKGVWQASKLKIGGNWALLGTTVAPSFEFEDLEVPSREDLIQIFPQHKEEITKYTKDSLRNC